MDLDIVSNCSSVSLQSEEIGSNVSTLSSLSIYQDEFAELRHLIDPTKYPSISFDKHSTLKSGGFQFEENIPVSRLSHHLQPFQQIQEKHNSDFSNVEKNLEIKYYDKIQKLLKTNYRLQSEIDRANEQIARLLKNFCSKPNTLSLLDKNFIHLEKKYHDLTLRYSELQYDFFQSKSKKEEYEIENKQLKTELHEIKIDIETKNECVIEFKDKISRQYVEIETLLKSNFKISQKLNEVISELAHVKKTQDWYKERLHLCQNEKQILSNEILKCKRDLCSQCDNIETLNVEVSKWRAKCDKIELEALKDKDKLYKQLESITFTNNCKNNQQNFDIEFRENTTCTINYYETSIQDLTHEIGTIKEYVQEQDNMIQKITKENSELISRCITLQKNIQHNEITIEGLEDVKKLLNAELDEIKLEAMKKSDEIMVRENQILSLQAELKVRKDEQNLIEQTVKRLREQFSVFKYKYNELKDDLFDKNKQILQVEDQKQKLFMENNWNVCELEKSKEKDVIINQLKDELTRNNETINKYLGTIKTMENEMNKNQDCNLILLDEKKNIIERDQLEIQKYEDALTQYNIMVTNYEKETTNLQKCLHETNAKVTDLKDNIKILEQEINQRDIALDKMNNQCKKLESELKCFKEIAKNSELSDNKNEIFAIDLQNCGDYTDNICNYETMLSDVTPTERNHMILRGNCSNTKQNKIYQEKLPTAASFKSQLKLKILELECKTKKLNETSNECYKTLNTIFCIVKDSSENEKVQKLNILLQVKELELKEKQKKYEANNRTLLRKVKEHMKGRSTAEKYNKYLQEMYNSLSEENNSLKLEVRSKECEIENIKNSLNISTNINEKLKLSLLKLEDEAVKNGPHDRIDSSNEKMELLEKCIKELGNEKLISQNLLMDKEDIIVNLQKEIQHLLPKNISLNRDNENFVDEIKNLLHEKETLTISISKLETKIKKGESDVDELNSILKQEQKQFSKIALENNHLRSCLDEINTQVEYLSNEVKILSSRLQIKSEEMTQLEDKKSKMESNWLVKEKDFQNIISTLKHYMYDMQLESNSINNEKYFLQRLCNDLKLALKSHVSHNKVLKQQLNIVSTEKDFISLPNIPVDMKYDDDYINQLLQQNRAPLQGKSITEMKSCLGTLKKEISVLQEQIARKNIQF